RSARTGMAAGLPAAARCVQRFDGSLNSAIHTTYRISLRSSSMPEPRDPLPKVFTRLKFLVQKERGAFQSVCGWACGGRPAEATCLYKVRGVGRATTQWSLCNDPSAGSPTETLLRLLLPLDDQVRTTYRSAVAVARLRRPVRRPH